ncbi:MAG: hypothetical protein HQK83_07075 [Fibrobacteria bacterium]|nr:hypothetical protein [Fibrobacteria bacterium]
MHRSIICFLILIFVVPIFSASLEDAHKLGAGDQGWVATHTDGTIHVVYRSNQGNKYQKGSAPDKMETATTVVPGLTDMYNPKLIVDPNGVPHLVYQKGLAGAGTTTWYTTIKDGKWIAPEKVSDSGELPDKKRSYVPDVAADKDGNILVSVWNIDNTKYRAPDNAMYRWRSPEGIWGELKSITGNTWSSLPKVEELNGGFYYLYQAASTDWKVIGPVEAGSDLSGGQAVNALNLDVANLNEGANLDIAADSTIAVASSLRRQSDGPSGIFCSIKKEDSFDNPEYLGDLPTKHEGDMHPNIAIDEATGAIVIVFQNTATNFASYYVYENEEWSSLQRVYPEADDAQTAWRTGPSVADIPGPGVVISVRNGDDIYLRKLIPEGEVLSNHHQTVPQNKTVFSQLGFIGKHTQTSVYFPSNDLYNITVSTIDGKIVGSHQQATAQTFNVSEGKYQQGLYIFDFKKVVNP